MKKTSRNPIAFTPLPVTIITSIIYAALIIALLVQHLVVPAAPTNPTVVKGINITEAWQDLQTLSNGYHPYNSRRNDFIRDWLLRRISEILEGNEVSYYPLDSSIIPKRRSLREHSGPSPVVIFNDMTSNITCSTSALPSPLQEPGLSVYFEGTNIIVYIRGLKDEDEDWWLTNKTYHGHGGVLVNAHYDSVSTGFGATDDGVGVVTVLQLIKFFTTSGQRPQRGIVALLNNGEEDFLNGARAFSQHPMSQFAHTFFNLEGAGAGGRATLFRSTDTEVTRFYQKSKYPFGTVLSGDGFERGFIRSQTDYVIFNGILGLRGLDVAFLEPRARYHTDQDDTRHTGTDSLWHMLSAALFTVQGLTADTSSTFDSQTHRKGKVPSGEGSYGVWFDLFGVVLAVFRLQTLFALSVTLLTVAPLVLIVIGAILYNVDKLYVFSSSKQQHHSEGDETVPLKGWRGFFRYPTTSVLASGGVIGLAFLVTKINPYIIYSSPYAVWSMMLSAWLFIAWFVSRAADSWRPTALHRAYSLLWMFTGCWLVLIAVTVLEQHFKVAGLYFMVFYFAAIFLATMIALLELFGLPRKSDYASGIEGHEERPVASLRSVSISSAQLLAPSADEQPRDDADSNTAEEDPEANESTSLLRGDRQTTFAHYGSPHHNVEGDEEEVIDEKKQRRVFGEEQAWSWSLPTWTWLLQFILLGPFVVILVGQVGLLFVSGTYQTLADGNSALAVYIIVAVFTVLFLAPLGPFLHRYTYHIPTFLLLVFVGTTVYNLIAFPFSTNNRLKLYFVQRVDLDTGSNQVSLSGLPDPYLNEAIHSLPSAAGQKLECSKSLSRRGLVECAWNGIPPRVVKNTHPAVPPQIGYADWLSFNISREPEKNEARFHLWGRNTRACKIQFNRAISDFTVDGAGDDSRFKRVPEEGSKEIRLWSRTWEKPWDVDVRWEVSEDRHAGEEGLDGRIVCLWSDGNESGVIPALDEVRHFAPDWVAVTKLGDGLVEGSKSFLA
ncbi:hypothetical protein MMC12_007115 [Toensbergia leucococca]|nr:hypothetical protein [Toensbergia leucococca]